MTLSEGLLVFFAALATDFACGLGALPFLFARNGLKGWLGTSNALASGVMLGATVGLLLEGVDRSYSRTWLGAVVGIAFVGLARRAVSGRELTAGSLTGADARKAVLIVGVMTLHSVAEGVGVGAAFGGGNGFGFLITLAIAIHNIPEGLAISLVLVPRGTRVRTAAFWSIFSSFPQPLLALPAYAFVEEFRGLLPAALGFAAGAMLWMVVRELLPEAIEEAGKRRVAAFAAGGCGAMVAFQTLLS